MTNFLAKKILYRAKIIFLQFDDFVTANDGRKKKHFSPPLFVLLLDPRSGIRGRGWIKIRIRDPGKTSRIRNTGFVSTYG
jgi:hypothetical protein